MDQKNRTRLEDVFFLPEGVVNELAQYKIHCVEQLLSLIQGEENTKTMAAALKLSPEDMVLIKKMLEASYPGIIEVPQRSKRAYPLGALDPKTKYSKEEEKK